VHDFRGRLYYNVVHMHMHCRYYTILSLRVTAPGSLTENNENMRWGGGLSALLALGAVIGACTARSGVWRLRTWTVAIGVCTAPSWALRLFRLTIVAGRTTLWIRGGRGSAEEAAIAEESAKTTEDVAIVGPSVWCTRVSTTARVSFLIIVAWLCRF